MEKLFKLTGNLQAGAILMKVMLININSREKQDPHKSSTPIVAAPLGLLYIASSALSAGHEVSLIDAYAESLSMEALLAKIKRQEPDLIGFTLYTNDLDYVYTFTKQMKKANSNLIIVTGGVYATIVPEKVLREFPAIDYLLRGEAERSFVLLLDELEKRKPLLERVDGLSYRKEGRIKHNKDACFQKNIDDLPLPAKYLLNRKKYFCALSKRSPIDVMITSRGCPYKCTFCYQSSPDYRMHSPERVLEEIREIADAGIKGIEIYDENFIVDKKRVNKILDMIQKENIGIEFRLRARVDSVNKNLLERLKKAGCSIISYGIEFGDQEILNKTNKGITLEMCENAIKMTKKAGIGTLGFFMMGVPGETRESIAKTINFAIKLNPDFAAFTVFMPMYKTKEYDFAKSKGWLIGDYGIGKHMPWVKLPWMKSLSDIQELRDYAFRKFYFRPNYMINFMLRNIRSNNWKQIDFARKNLFNHLNKYNPI